MGLIGKIFVKLGLDNSEFKKGMNDSEKQASGFQNSLKKIGGMMAGAFSVSAVLNFAKKSVQAYNESQQAITKLESVLRSTGGAAGWTSEQLQSYAGQLQRVTMFEDDATIAAMAVLASFKAIRGDVFKGVIKAAMDMSTVIGGDLQSNVYQLAKALERPAEGIQLLNRSTRAFSLAQIEDIKALVKEGKTHEAQLMILTTLQGKFGGAAEDAAQTGVGAWTRVTNAVGDLMEKIGEASNKTKSFANVLATTLEFLGSDAGEVSIWTKLGFLAGSPLAMQQMQKAAAKTNKIRKAAEAYANTQMASIKSVEDAEARLLVIQGLSSASWDLLREKLTNYIAERKKAGEVDVMTEEEREEAAKKAEEAAKKREEAIKKAKEAKIATIKQEIAILMQLYGKEEDSVNRAFIFEDIKAKREYIRELENEGEIRANGIIPQLEEEVAIYKELQNWTDNKELIKSLEEEVRLRTANLQKMRETDAQRLKELDITLTKPKTPSVVSPYNTGLGRGEMDKALRNWRANQKREGDQAIKDTQEQFDALDMMAVNFNEKITTSISNGIQTLIDSLVATGKVDAGSVVAALLSPFGDMLIQLGEIAIGAGLGVEAIKDSLSSWSGVGAVIAGAAMIALGSLVKAGVKQLSVKGAGATNPSSFTGGSSYSAIPAVSSASDTQLVTILKGEDLWVMNQKVQQRKGR